MSVSWSSWWLPLRTAVISLFTVAVSSRRSKMARRLTLRHRARLLRLRKSQRHLLLLHACPLKHLASLPIPRRAKWRSAVECINLMIQLRVYFPHYDSVMICQWISVLQIRKKIIIIANQKNVLAVLPVVLESSSNVELPSVVVIPNMLMWW